MSYCYHCGKELRNGAKYCDHCGKEQNCNLNQSGNKKQLHCPVCKSLDIIPIVNGHSSGGTGSAVGFGSGIIIGRFDSETTIEHGWLCRSCGINFERIEELYRKQSYYKTVLVTAVSFAIIAIIATIYALITRIDVLLWVTIPCVVIFGIIAWIAKAIANSIIIKTYYLEMHCFD